MRSPRGSSDGVLTPSMPAEDAAWEGRGGPARRRGADRGCSRASKARSIFCSPSRAPRKVGPAGDLPSLPWPSNTSPSWSVARGAKLRIGGGELGPPELAADYLVMGLPPGWPSQSRGCSCPPIPRRRGPRARSLPPTLAFQLERLEGDAHRSSRPLNGVATGPRARQVFPRAARRGVPDPGRFRYGTTLLRPAAGLRPGPHPRRFSAPYVFERDRVFTMEQAPGADARPDRLRGAMDRYRLPTCPRAGWTIPRGGAVRSHRGHPLPPRWSLPRRAGWSCAKSETFAPLHLRPGGSRPMAG